MGNNKKDWSVTDFATNYYTKIYDNEVYPRFAHISFEQIFGYAKSFIKKADDVLGAINNIKTIKRKGNALSSQIEELFELECEFRNKIKNYPSDNSRSLLGITKNHDELLFYIRGTYLEVLPYIASWIEGIKKMEIARELEDNTVRNLQSFSSSYEVSVNSVQLEKIQKEHKSKSLYWAQPIPTTILFKTSDSERDKKYIIHLPILYLNHIGVIRCPMHTIKGDSITLNELNITSCLPDQIKLNSLIDTWNSTTSEVEKYRSLKDVFFSKLFPSNDETIKSDRHRSFKQGLERFYELFNLCSQNQNVTDKKAYLTPSYLSSHITDLKAFYIYRTYCLWKSASSIENYPYCKFHGTHRYDGNAEIEDSLRFDVKYYNQYLKARGLYEAVSNKSVNGKKQQDLIFKSLSNTAHIYIEDPTIYDELIALFLVNLDIKKSDLMPLLCSRVSRDQKQEALYRAVHQIDFRQEVEWFKRTSFSKAALYQSSYIKKAPRSVLLISQLYFYQCIYQERLQQDVFKTLQSDWKNIEAFTEDNISRLIELINENTDAIFSWIKSESKNLKLEGTEFQRILIDNKVSRVAPLENKVKSEICQLIFKEPTCNLSAYMSSIIPLVPILGKSLLSSDELKHWLYLVCIAFYLKKTYLTDPKQKSIKFESIRSLPGKERKVSPYTVIDSQYYEKIPVLFKVVSSDLYKDDQELPLIYKEYYKWLAEGLPYTINIENIWKQEWYLPPDIYGLNGFTRCAIYHLLGLLFFKYYEKKVPRYYAVNREEQRLFDAYLKNIMYDDYWINDYISYLQIIWENKS